MTADFLTRLARRTLGVEPLARPRTAALFEPVSETTMTGLAASAEAPSTPSLVDGITGRTAVFGRAEPQSFTPRAEHHSPVRPPKDAPERQDELQPPPKTPDATAAHTGALDSQWETLATSPVIADEIDPRPAKPSQQLASRSAPRQARWTARLELNSPPPRLAQMPLNRPASEPLPTRGAVPSVPRRAEEVPEIKVSIGRIEVRAVTPPPPAAARPERPRRMMSLDDYLRRGGTGR